MKHLEFLKLEKSQRKSQTSDPDLGSVFSKILKEEISLDASYQRDVVWNESKQSMLIDSIFFEMYIPALLFSYREEKFFCVDGKQRLMSLQKFMTNEIPYKVNKTKVFYSEIPEKFSKSQDIFVLSDKQRSWFDSRSPMRFVTFFSLDEETEMKMFQRIQDGVQLKYTEKLLANQRPVVRYCVETLQNLYGDDMDALKSNKRKEHLLFFLRVYFLCKNNKDTGFLSRRKIQELIEKEDQVSFSEEVEKVMDYHSRFMSQYEKKPLWFFLATTLFIKYKEDEKTNSEFSRIRKWATKNLDDKLTKTNVVALFKKV